MKSGDESLKNLLRDVRVPPALASQLKKIPTILDDRLDELLKDVTVSPYLNENLKRIHDSVWGSFEQTPQIRSQRIHDDLSRPRSRKRRSWKEIVIAASILTFVVSIVTWYFVEYAPPRLNEIGKNFASSAIQNPQSVDSSTLELANLEQRIAQLEDELIRAKLNQLEEDLLTLKAEISVTKASRENRVDDSSLKLAYHLESQILGGRDPSELKPHLEIINEVYPDSAGLAKVHDIFSRIH